MDTGYSRSLNEILGIIRTHDRDGDITVTCSDNAVTIGMKNLDKWSLKLMGSILFDLEERGFSPKYGSIKADIPLEYSAP